MELHTELPASRQAPRRARALVRQILTGVADCHTVDDAVLVVSELVTNAVRYGAEPISLHLTLDSERLVIAVKDASPSVLPYPKILTQTEPNGRGMHLISAASSRWGWDRSVNSKIVWAEIEVARHRQLCGTGA